LAGGRHGVLGPRGDVRGMGAAHRDQPVNATSALYSPNGRKEEFSEVHTSPIASELVLRLARHTVPFSGLGDSAQHHYPSLPSSEEQHRGLRVSSHPLKG
jgi:hypothetical protein